MNLYLALAAGLLGFAGAARAATTELRIATVASDPSPAMTLLNQEASDVKAKTAGRVTIKYFQGGVQGDERDYIRKIKLGQLDGAMVTGGVGLAMIDQSLRVLELPSLFASAEEVDYVADKVWPTFQARFAAKSFVLDARGEVGWSYVLSATKIDSVAALKSQKMWLWGDDQLFATLYKTLGLNGVPLGLTEVDPALTVGKITACYGSPSTAVALKWIGKVKYMTSMPLNFGIGATVYSLAAMQKLSADDQKTLAAIGATYAPKLRATVRTANADASALMAKGGVTIVPSPPSMVNDVATAAQQEQAALTGKIFSQDQLNLVLQYRAEYRAAHK